MSNQQIVRTNYVSTNLLRSFVAHPNDSVCVYVCVCVGGGGKFIQM